LQKQLISYIKTYIYDFRGTFNAGQKKKNLSQSEVGKKININEDAVRKYERNEVKPTS